MKYNHRCNKREGSHTLVAETREPQTVLDIDPGVIDDLIGSGDIEELQRLIDSSKEGHVGCYSSTY